MIAAVHQHKRIQEDHDRACDMARELQDHAYLLGVETTRTHFAEEIAALLSRAESAERAMRQMAEHDSDGLEFAHVVALKGQLAIERKRLATALDALTTIRDSICAIPYTDNQCSAYCRYRARDAIAAIDELDKENQWKIKNEQ